jgi:hypothetical protein
MASSFWQSTLGSNDHMALPATDACPTDERIGKRCLSMVFAALSEVEGSVRTTSTGHDAEHERITQYIRDNPANWKEDRFDR